MSGSKTIETNAVLIGAAAGLALISGGEVMTVPHLILGLILLQLARPLDNRRAHRGIRSACSLLVFATIMDAILIAFRIYDLQGGANPFRPRWLGYLLIWVVFNVMQAGPEEGRPDGPDREQAES